MSAATAAGMSAATATGMTGTATAAGCTATAAVRSRRTRCCMTCRRTGSACACSTATGTRGRYRMSAAACARCSAATAGRSAAAARRVAASCCLAPTAAIASATAVNEPMPTPAVAITPAGPGAHSQEDPVIEVSRPVKTIGRAGIRRIVVVAVLANRLNTNAYPNHNLCLCRRRQGNTREQCCSTEEKLESAHFSDPLKVSAVPCIA